MVKIERVSDFYRDWEPQDLLARKYKSMSPLPIRGGWGYSKEDAVVIDTTHPAAAHWQPFQGVRIEHAFAQLRMYEELIGIRPEGSQHAGCEKRPLEQMLVRGDEGKLYDVLRFEIKALPLDVWERLKAEWEAGVDSPGFDRAEHECRREAAMVRYVGEYWFEISSFFGK